MKINYLLLNHLVTTSNEDMAIISDHISFFKNNRIFIMKLICAICLLVMCTFFTMHAYSYSVQLSQCQGYPSINIISTKYPTIHGSSDQEDTELKQLAERSDCVCIFMKPNFLGRLMKTSRKQCYIMNTIMQNKQIIYPSKRSSAGRRPSYL